MVTPRPLLALLLLLGSVAFAGAASAGEFGRVAPADVAAVIAEPNGPLLLDVRTDEEFAGGHVPGALLIPVKDLPDRLDELESFKARGVVAYCEKGGRATRALEILQEAGFQNLQLMDGSMERYRKENP